jgi:tetratricopeptide (TPR) repeat protein
MLRHFNNIWTYILAVIFLYLVFRNYWFKDNQDLAFLSALIFLIHPIHSEVVAVVCRRDEIFSLLFIALTFLFAFKYMESKKTKTLFWASIMFLLALLSKEYAIVLLTLVPLAFYVFNKVKISLETLLPPTLIFIAIGTLLILVKEQKIISSGLPFIGITLLALGVYILTAFFGFRKALQNKDLSSVMIWFYGAFIIYLGMRTNAVSLTVSVPDTEILNNPYLLANGEERFCTKTFVLLKYLVLQIFPHPLISDYSYDAIAYRHFGDWDFILSLILHITLFVLGIKLLIKRHVMGFVITCYFAFLLIIANVFFDCGINMNEHFIFHASIAFAIAIAWMALKGLDKVSQIKLPTKKAMLFSSLTIVLILFGYKTWERNWDWKNDVTLFLKDVNNSPNSVLILGNAGARWIDLADTKEITGVNIPGQDPTVFNDYNGTLKITDEDLKLGGYKDKREAALYKGIGYLLHAIRLHPRYVNGYLNLGLAYYKVKMDFETIFYWKMAERLYPNNPYLRNYYIVYYNDLKKRGSDFFNEGKFAQAIVAYNLCTIVDPNNPDGWYNLGGTYFKLQGYKNAKVCWENVLKIDPSNKEAIRVLDELKVIETTK